MPDTRCPLSFYTKLLLPSFASGAPAGVVSGAPAGVASGAPAGVVSGAPAGVASGAPAGVASGAPGPLRFLHSLIVVKDIFCC